MERVEEFRGYCDARNDDRRCIAAVGSKNVPNDVRDFALKNGLFVVQRVGNKLAVIPPEGEPRVWYPNKSRPVVAKQERRKTMSQQTSPLTYEGILELFRQTDQRIDRKFQEVAEQIEKTNQEVAEQIKKTNQDVGSLTSRIGEIVENMIGGGNIVKQFQALNIAIHSHCRDKTFGTRGTSESGQIDVFLENGGFVILIEVKTKPTQDDVREHIERMKKYRLYGNDKRRILGAIAGAVVPDKVAEFAHKKGIFVIVQSGEAVEIIPQPEGFTAKEW